MVEKVDLEKFSTYAGFLGYLRLARVNLVVAGERAVRLKTVDVPEPYRHITAGRDIEELITELDDLLREIDPLIELMQERR
jgi:hypothetical protein